MERAPKKVRRRLVFFTFIAIPGLTTTMLLFSFFATFLEYLLSLKHIHVHSYWYAPLELYCISNNECGDFTVVLKLETVILFEAMVLLGRSVHPTTLFPGLMLWYLSGWRWGLLWYFSIIRRRGSFFFFFFFIGGGGVKTLNFNTFWGFYEKKMYLF